MADAIKDAVESGESFEGILETINELKKDGGIKDEKSLTALDEMIDSYQDQTDEIKAGNEALDKRLKKQQDIAKMSPLDAANEKRRNELKELSEEVPKRLSDNLESSISNAMDNLADGTYDSLGDVFLNIALDFGKALQQEISAAVAKNLVQSFTSSGIGKGLMNFGGDVTQAAGGNYNSGGMVTGGSGVMDDVPAKLTGGEYVIKKSAVQKYGAGFLDRLNSGGIQGMQNGGPLKVQGADNMRTDKFWSDSKGYSAGGARSRAFLEEAKKRDFFVPGQRGFGEIVGKENLLAFAQQGVTSGSTDLMSSGPGGASINLEDQSARLTAFGRRRDSPAKRALEDAQAQAFDLYNQSAAEEQRVIQENKDAKTARRKAFQQAVVGAFVNATMAGVSAGISNVQAGGTFFGDTATQNLRTASAGMLDGQVVEAGTSIRNLEGMTQTVSQPRSFLGFKYNRNVLQPTALGTRFLDSANTAASNSQSFIFNSAAKSALSSSAQNAVQSAVQDSYRAYSPSPSNYANTSHLSYAPPPQIMPNRLPVDPKPYLPGGRAESLMYGNQGSPYTRYNRIPASLRANGGMMASDANALLMDGEYVMGSEASSSLGRDTLDSINTMNYANGGPVGGSTAGGGSGENADVGTLNIEINIEKDGTSSASASGSGEEDPEKAKAFSRKVKDVVLNVINEEKRVSGSLFTRNK
jgi:hypothetical protein